MASKCIAQLTWLWPLCSHDHGLQVHLHTSSMTISECIFKFSRSWSPNTSPNMFEYPLQVNLQTRLITASDCNSELTRSSFSGPPLIAHCYTFRICHSSSVMNNYSMMLSCGDWLWFINVKQVLLPQESRPGKYSSTPSLSPTLDCCPCCNGLLIQRKPRLLDSLCTEKMNDTNYRHLFTK